MTKKEKICLWIYAVMAGICVIFFRPLEKLCRGYLFGGGGDFAQALTVVFTILGAILIFINTKKGDIGAAIMLCVFNFWGVGIVFYGVSWLLEHVFP